FFLRLKDIHQTERTHPYCGKPSNQQNINIVYLCFKKPKKFIRKSGLSTLATASPPRYDAFSEGIPIGSGPRTVARCGKRSQLLRLPYPGSNFSKLRLSRSFRSDRTLQSGPTRNPEKLWRPNQQELPIEHRRRPPGRVTRKRRLRAAGEAYSST